MKLQADDSINYDTKGIVLESSHQTGHEDGTNIRSTILKLRWIKEGAINGKKPSASDDVSVALTGSHRCPDVEDCRRGQSV